MKKKVVVLSLSLLMMLIITGCISGPFSQFYQQVSPTTYSRTKNVMVFYYPHADLQEIYNYLFSDYVIIGKADFIGQFYNPYESTNYSNITSFGKSIGADVLICAARFSNTEIAGTETAYNKASSKTKIVKNEKYEQRGMFLRNVNNVVPVWNQTIKNYEKTVPNELEGVWFNKDYELDIFQSYNQVVGFIHAIYAKSPRKKGWKTGDLIFNVNVQTGQGIYLASNRVPAPAEMNLTPNKFGFLELTLSPTNQIISFQKKR